jgi:hypothetical protein
MSIPSISIQIDPGDHARTVEITCPFYPPVELDLTEQPWLEGWNPEPIPPADEAWGILLGCLVPGFFGWDGTRAPTIEQARRSSRGDGFLAEIVTTLPPMSQSGVTSLLRALSRYTSAPDTFVAHEVGATSPPIRSLRALPAVAIPKVPFELEISPHLYKFLTVEITLESPLTERSIARLSEISKRWALLVQLHAFRGEALVPEWSEGWLEDASQNLDDEWIIRFGSFAGDREVAGPLCEALTLLHAEQPISSVLVRGR